MSLLQRHLLTITNTLLFSLSLTAGLNIEGTSDNGGSCCREHVDSRERLLVVVGFDAANIMRSRSVQSLHEKLKRAAELKQTEKHVKNANVDTDVTLACRGQRGAHLMADSLAVLLVGSFGSRPRSSDIHSGRL